MQTLDTVAKEARFAMLLGGKKRNREESDRVFQFGTFQGRAAKFTYLYAHGRIEKAADSRPEFCSEAEFDAHVGRYDVDARWTRR